MRRPDPAIRPETARRAWDAAAAPSDDPCGVTLRCELVTPVYGGGVTPGEVDRAMPIRAAALRGNLRFWWRLLRCTGSDGKAFRDDAQKLFRAETKLWGGISGKGPQASRVAVRVHAARVEPGDLVAWKSGNGVDGNFPAYALILKPDDNPQLLKERHAFRLTLRFTTKVTDEQRHQVIEALRWWASFGGVGARTRRGLGAVRVSGDNPELKPVSAQEVEQRGGWLLTGRPETDPFAAWRRAVDALQKFRQGPDVGRNRGQGNRPGRSRWPEADAIRRLAGKHASGHEPEHPMDGEYPRAAFGLPIVFHFKDEKRGDPPYHTLVPRMSETDKKQDRMASPLILRPWFDGRRWRPAALLLPGWEDRVSVPVGLDSKGKPVSEGKPAWPNDADERKRSAARIPPMRSRGEDALAAFMRFFQEQMDRPLRPPDQRPHGRRPRRGY